MRKQNPTLFILALAVLCAIATVMPTHVALAQDLTERLERIERDLKVLQRQVYRQSTDPAAAGSQQTPGAAGGQVASLQAKSLQIETLLQNLTGQVEELQFQVRQLQDQLRLVADDTSLRLTRLEQEAGLTPMASSLPQSSTPRSGGPRPGVSQQGTPMGQSAPETIGQPLGSNQRVFGQLAVDEDGNPLDADDIPMDQRMASAPSRPAARDLPPPQMERAPSPPPVARGALESTQSFAPVALPAGTAADQYAYALGLLRQRDYDRAQQALILFMEAHPDDELAGNAQYWLGETYYVRDDFEQAAVNFMKGYRTYPSSSKAPDNLLKLGITLARLDQTDQACQTFKQLTTQFPGANQSILRRVQQEEARLSCQ